MEYRGNPSDASFSQLELVQIQNVAGQRLREQAVRKGHLLQASALPPAEAYVRERPDLSYAISAMASAGAAGLS